MLAGSAVSFLANTEGSGHTSTTSPHATATIGTPIQVPSVTFMTTPSPTPQPLFSDYFIDNSNGWLIGDARGYKQQISDGTLSLSVTNHKILVESLPLNSAFGDFLLTTIFTFQQGNKDDRIGLFLRGDSTLDRNYRIDIDGNNTYKISKEGLDTQRNPVTTLLVGPTTTTALKPLGQTNELTVIMKEATLMLIINGIVVKSISDPDYTQGQTALFVQHGENSKGVLAVFHSIELYPAPDELPAP
jgi:hypothetical protein